MVRAPLRCFLIVSLRPSGLAFYSRLHVHRGEGRKSGMKGRGAEERSRGIFNVLLIRLIHSGRGFQSFSAWTNCFHTDLTDFR